MTSKIVLDEFGQSFIRAVRDHKITKYDKVVNKIMKDEESRELSDVIDRFSTEQKKVIRELVVHSVDEMLHNFLWFLEQNEGKYDLIATEKNTAYNLAEESDGLCGELYSEDGWIQQFSKYETSEKMP